MKESEVERYLLYLGEGPVVIPGTAKSHGTARRRSGVAVVLLGVLVLLIAVTNFAFSGPKEEVSAGVNPSVANADLQPEQRAYGPSGVNGQSECAEFCVLFRRFLYAFQEGLLVTAP